MDDCFDLAKLSYDEGDFYHTAMWVEEALAMLGNHESRKDKHVEMLDYLAFSYYKVLPETSRDVIVRFMSFRSSSDHFKLSIYFPATCAASIFSIMIMMATWTSSRTCQNIQLTYHKEDIFTNYVTLVTTYIVACYKEPKNVNF